MPYTAKRIITRKHDETWTSPVEAIKTITTCDMSLTEQKKNFLKNLTRKKHIVNNLVKQ